MDKMIGTRMHMWIINKIGLGASYAYDRWNNDTNLSAPTAPLAMHMFAVDGQFRIAGFEARGGWSEMLVALPGDAMTRGGWYGELSQKFGKTQNWKVMLRGGQVQLDNRVLAQSDQTIVGATVLWRPNVVEFSLEYSKDLDWSVSKLNHDYAALRAVMSF
ncbi:MAG: hypothetical protein ACXVBW_09940, partial [Bdellovibrionota bacterium]